MPKQSNIHDEIQFAINGFMQNNDHKRPTHLVMSDYKYRELLSTELGWINNCMFTGRYMDLIISTLVPSTLADNIKDYLEVS